MVSHQRTYLTKLREKGQSDPQSTLEHLDTLVQQYPYFQALHHLEWKIANENALLEETSLLQTCSLHTKNRLHLIANPATTEDFISFTTEQNSANEVRSFVEWLHELNETVPQQNEESRLIDKFIANAPKIVVDKSATKHEDLTRKQQFDEQALMTETLAEIYVKQGKLKKAKNAYEILTLKYPEKSGFFADQIRKITNAQNEN